MTDSLFTGANADDNNDAPQIDPNKNYVEELVGEGKKFKTLEDLARSVLHKDHFIERLKGETEGLRTELNTRLTLEQYLDKMGKNENQNNGRSDLPPNEPNSGDPDTKALKPEDIEALIEQKVTERERRRIQSQNMAEVRQKLVEAFGNDYPSKLKEVGSSLGLSEDHLNAMAAESPKAFLKLVGAENVQQRQPENNLFVPPSSSTVRTPSAPSGDRTKKFYDDLKKRDPKEYWSPSVQNQLHKDALRLGEKFFD